jgi:hypothetical protein
MVETRNRKPMRPNPLAPWELRLGSLRVYFDVVIEPEPVVVVLAVGVKERSAVRIGKAVLDLLRRWSSETQAGPSGLMSAMRRRVPSSSRSRGIRSPRSFA